MSERTHHQYVIALGSNQRHHRDGPPERVLVAAIEVLEDVGLHVHAASPILRTEPVGPSSRMFANAAIMVETFREPDNLLALLKEIERIFGRHAGGQAWRARVLDLDIVLWDGGIWTSDRLAIPHPCFREREFVLGPALRVAPDWRDPVTGLSVRQLHHRLTRRTAVPRGAPAA